MSFLQYFSWSYWLIPSYAPSYGNLGNYDIWGQSILMYFFLICTAFTLAMVTLMDTDSPAAADFSSAPITEMMAPTQVPNVVGGKKLKHKTKSKRNK